jgi:hypothetical protein
MKTCAKCSLSKEFTDFSPNKRTKDGYHTVCKPCAAKASREWQQANKEQQRNSQRRRNLKKHGITIEQYEELFNQQNGVCAICAGPPTGPGAIHGTLNIDHDHSCCSGAFSCGKCIRGLLCGNCNTAIGLLKDNIEVVYIVANYLENNGTRPDR